MKLTSQPNSVTTTSKGFRTYNVKGIDRPIVARKGGPTSEEVKSKESYGELRKNQKEFGVASMMAKVLRQSLSEGMSEICETYASGKLTAQFRNLAKQEEGETGKRPMYLSKHGHLLNGFEFNSEFPYKKLFDAKYFVKTGSRKGQVILHFPSFVPHKAFVKPAGATNFKINVRLVALSDYSYNRAENTYTPKSPELHGMFGSYETPMLPLLKMPTEPMTSQVSINTRQVIPESVGIFLVMAVSFYKYEGGRFQHLAKESGMQIHEVY
ncbi:MAG: hypothetical protein JXQ90_22865 [Cyclobacteriaceae bacterium]